jgi:hypothetical protein
MNMNADFKRLAAADLRALLALVAGSGILFGPVRQPDPLFADWEKERKSADVDAVILAWIAGFARGAAHRGRLH